MKKMCMNCFKMYALSRRIPCGNCGSNLVEIDELYIVIIKILNQKGYKTAYCCSGHIYENLPQSYILFSAGIKLPYLPQNYITVPEEYDNNEPFRNETQIRRNF